jgi:hypothetical protein
MANKPSTEYLISQMDENMPLYQAVEIMSRLKDINLYSPLHELGIQTLIYGGLAFLGGFVTGIMQRKRHYEERMTHLRVQ